MKPQKNVANEVKYSSIILYMLLLTLFLSLNLNSPAHAQTLKNAGMSLFAILNSIVGIVGAIAITITGINMAIGNKLGLEQPGKSFGYAVGGTFVGFAAVNIVLWVKDLASTGSSASQL